MAHKHSRRGQRPRSRNHDSASFGLFQYHQPVQPSYYDPTSFSDKTAATIAWTSMPAAFKQNVVSQGILNARNVVHNYGSAVGRSRRYTKQITKTTTTPSPVLMDKSELEEEQIKLFGGEPGDDPSLCFKMLEAFGRMEWIDG